MKQDIKKLQKETNLHEVKHLLQHWLLQKKLGVLRKLVDSIPGLIFW